MSGFLEQNKRTLLLVAGVLALVFVLFSLQQPNQANEAFNNTNNNDKILNGGNDGRDNAADDKKDEGPLNVHGSNHEQHLGPDDLKDARPVFHSSPIEYIEFDQGLPQCRQFNGRIDRAQSKNQKQFLEALRKTKTLHTQCGITSPQLDDGTRCMPNFIIVGCMKCASTFLNYYLIKHSRILYHVHKEQVYFQKAKFKPIDSPQFKDELDVYRSQLCVPRFIDHENFGPAVGDPACSMSKEEQKLWRVPEEEPGHPCVIGESTPLYLNPPNIAERIHSVLPDVKIVFSLRDAATRAYSQWNHANRMGQGKPSADNQPFGMGDMTFEMAVTSEVAALAACQGEKYMPKLPEEWKNDKDLKTWYDFANGGGWKKVAEDVKSGAFYGNKRISNNVPNYQPCMNSCKTCWEIEGEPYHEFKNQAYMLVQKSMYGVYVEEYIRVFGRENVLVLDYNVVTQETPKAFVQLENFVGFDHHDWADTDFKAQFPNKYKPVNAATHKFLTEFYKPFNERLWAAIGERFPGWSE